MTTPRRPFKAFLVRVAGTDPRVRRHLGLHVAACVIYLTTAVIMGHTAWIGAVDVQVLKMLLACMLGTFSTFTLLIRTGWSQRFDDPVLTLPHAMVSLVIIVMAYVTVGDYRADVLILLAQVLAVSMFRLHPRETLFLGMWALGWLSLAQVGLVWAGVGGFGLGRALAHFIVSAASLAALSVVGMWISAMRLRVSGQSEALRRTLAQAQALATTDMLTGLVNRRSMTDILESEIALASRSGRPLCVALIDIDHFKKVNDLRGHRAGDEVLRTFASLAQRDLRQVDTFGRWGGEEFLLLMPMVQAEQAWAAIERLRTQVAAHAMGDGGRFTVTLSAGVAQWRVGEGLDAWLERADKALYAAKDGGRNRCMVADGDLPPGRRRQPPAAEPVEPLDTPHVAGPARPAAAGNAA